MRSVLFTVFGHPVYSYGAALALAFAFGLWHALRLGARDGIKRQATIDAATAAMISALLGARLAHVLIEDPARFRAEPWEALRLWEGGLVFYGGFIACFLTVPFVLRYHKVPFWNAADSFAPAIAIGHGIVRFGCFLNGCCYGRPASWGLILREVDGHPRQPSQLYESAFGVLFFFIVLHAWKTRRFRGQAILVYLFCYAVARFLIEFTRDDSERGQFGPLYTSQWVAIGIAITSAVLWPWLRRTQPMPPPSGATAQAA